MQTTSQYILDSSKDYSIYVAQSRAIPSVTDGLKDGQRKALWLLKSKSDKIKTVSLAGEMISSNLYLHGDASASATLSFLAAPFLNNVPLIEGIGTFGTRVAPASGIGAPRYTYCKKSKVAEKFLYNDIDIIPMKENYDGSVMEPVTFLPLIPLVLLNGISGIAVGWSTDILPRSLADLKQAVIDCLEGKKIQTLVPKYTFLDVTSKKLEDNAWEFSGRIEKVDSSTIRVTEIPPEIDFEKFKDKLDKMEDEGIISSYEDSSTKTIDILVKFKRGSLKDVFDEGYYLDLLKLRTKKTERIVVLDWNGKSIRQYPNAEELVKDFVDWRFKHYIRRYENFLALRKVDLHFATALLVLFEKGFSNTVKALKNRKEIEDKVTSLISPITLDKGDTDKIVSLPIYRWTEEYHEKAKKEVEDLKKEIAMYELLLSKPEKIKLIYKKELEAI